MTWAAINTDLNLIGELILKLYFILCGYGVIWSAIRIGLIETFKFLFKDFL